MYDSVLKKSINVSRATVGIPGGDKVTFADLNDRPLILPPLVFPFRRAFARHAKSAYDIAIRSSADHLVAVASMPSEEQWCELWDYCKDNSPDCSEVAFFND